MLNVEDVELAESVRLANVCVRSNFSNASNDVDEEDEEEDDEADEDEDDVIVCSFDWELSRLSREMSLFENEMLFDARGRDKIFEQRLRINGQ